MQLKGFLLKTNLMFKDIQVLSRAPPIKAFPRYRDLPGQSLSWENENGETNTPLPISGIKNTPEGFFDQSVNW